VKEEYKSYLLQNLMAECTDFKEEKTALEDLFEKLSEKGRNRISILESPKYHPEIAGEGIELVWGLMKRYFRSIALEMKKSKEKFANAVKDSVRFVNKQHANRFAAKNRRYMLAYKHHECCDASELTYESIERFQRRMKCHRNSADQDKKLINKVWKELMVRE